MCQLKNNIYKHMKKVLLVLILGFHFLNASAQMMQSQGARSNSASNKNQTSNSNKSAKIKLSAKTKYTDYKIFNADNDTTIVDTTLTLKKDYKFNYLRKDNFGLLPFHNQGQTFNNLYASFENNSLFPLMGMEAKQYNYYAVDDIKYYYVPTPTTEVMYRTGLEQGQVLDAFLTMNTSEQFNFSLAYKGLRSLGKYRESLSSHGNFRTTFNYHSKNKVYDIKGHFMSFDLLNNENGGLTEESIAYFESNDPNYIDRGRLDVNYADTENLLEGKRYYIDQSLVLFSKKNTLKKNYIEKVNIEKRFKLDSINKAILLAKQDSINLSSDSIIPKIIPKEILEIEKRNIKSDTTSIVSLEKDTLNVAKISLDSSTIIIAKKDSLNFIKSVLDSTEIAIPKMDTIVPSKLNDAIITSDSLNTKIIQKEIISIKRDSLNVPRISLDSTEKAIPKMDTIVPSKLNDAIITSDSLNTKIIQKEIISIKRDSLNVPRISLDSTENAIPIMDSIPNLTKKKSRFKGNLKGKVVSKDSVKVTFSTLDSINGIKNNFELKIGHKFIYETKHYRFNKSSAGTFFGNAFASPIADHTSYQNLDNQLYFEVNSPFIGTLRAKANYIKYNYHYNSILYLDSLTISDKLKGNVLSAGADWKATIGKLTLLADANSIVSGDLTGHSLKTSISYKKDSVYSIKGYGEITSKSPSFNKVLFQSGFKDYNWKNNFDNEEIKNAGLEIEVNKWGSIQASYNLIDNFTYFDTISKPKQSKEQLKYLKVKANQYFTFRNFTIDNTVMYQNVLEGESFFHVPQIITRNTLYYSNYLFKGKPLYLQTGVTFNYFTTFKSNAYNPLLSEFVLQNETEIGNFPILDFFINLQIRRTRIFLKAENFGASFTGRNYYAAPNYPYRDLTIRFGLVWNFFI